MEIDETEFDLPPAPVQPTGVVFSNNRSIPQNFKDYSGAFDYHEEMNMYVFGTVGGSVAYRSPRYQFDLDNPIEDQCIRAIQFADHNGLVVSLTGHHVQVWDVFYDPKLGQYVHRVVHAGKPSALSAWRSAKSILIGTKCGKVHLMDMVKCSSESKYSGVSYLPSLNGIEITFLSVYDSEFASVGSADGLVRLFKLPSKKCVGQLKSPGGIRSPVVSVSVLPSRDFPPTRSFAVCYANEQFVAVFSHTYHLLLTVRTEVPVLRAFGVSVDWEKDGLLVHLNTKKLVLLEGTKWAAHASDLLSEPTTCTAVNYSADGQNLLTLESFSLEERTLLGKRIRTKWGAPIPSRSSIISFLDHKDSRTENNLVRLSNLLQDRPLAENFLREWNDHQIEGVYVTVVPERCKLQWTVFSNSSSFCMGETGFEKSSDFEIVTAVDICSLEGTDKWSVLLGYSSGKVGLLESSTVLNTSGAEALESMWKKITWIDGPSGIHAGARIKKISRNSDMCVSIDVNGMCCFFKPDSPEEEPSHVAICGENGMCFLDTNCAYLCMADGTIERARGPRKSVEESMDVDAWDTLPILDESIGLSGEFLNIFVKQKCVVRESGFTRVTFPTKHGQMGQLGKVVTVGDDDNQKIVSCRLYFDFLILVSMNALWVFDLGSGSKSNTCVFNRDISFPPNTIPYISPSMHVIVPGHSITSLLFTDRTKEMYTTAPIVDAAREFYKMAKVQAVEAPITKAPSLKLPKPTKNAPTADQLDYARELLRQNLESVAKLEDDAAALHDDSEEFLKIATRLAEGPPKEKKKSFWNKLFK